MNKICTDINQPKKIIELGIDVNTADMYYHPYPNDEYWYDVPNIGNADLKFNQLPCWSLAALLSVIPNVSLNSFKDGNWNAAMEQQNGKMIYSDADNPIDACVKMILKLHELKML